MCYVLTAEEILLNYFAEQNEVTKISFQELGEISCRIVRRCNNSIITSITVEEIRSAAYRRSAFMKVEDASVVLIDRSFTKYISIYNRGIPERVKSRCIEICRDYAPKHG